MTRVAYLDEFPWVRCPCGWILNLETKPCPGCGQESEIERRDRFARSVSTDVYGNVYQPVPYEDVYRVIA